MGIHTETVRAAAKMKSIVSITVAILALAKAANCQLEWQDVCDEGHQYLVIPENDAWTDHALECGLFGGWLTVLETREEMACIAHWVETADTPASQKFAISMSSDYFHPDQYLWRYPDGTTVVPDYEEWATDHPQGGICVSMTNGQWVDGDCSEEPVFAICERGEMISK